MHRQAKMTAYGTGCSEMAAPELQAITLWESSYSDFESLAESQRLNLDTCPYKKLVNRIRGTFLHIISYFTSFDEFGESDEALAITFSSIDALQTCKSEAGSESEYLKKLLNYLEEVASEIHNSCFVTQHSNLALDYQTVQRTVPKPVQKSAQITVKSNAQKHSKGKSK